MFNIYNLKFYFNILLFFGVGILAAQIDATKIKELSGGFRKNQGQWDSRILFAGKASGWDANVTFQKDGLCFGFMRPASNDKKHSEVDEDNLEFLSWKMNFMDANPSVSVRSLGEKDSKVNYLLGKDISKHITNVKDYSFLEYKNIYKNIDIHYYQSKGSLKYDYLIHPNGNLNNLKIAISGVKKLLVNSSGELEITTAWGTLIEKMPESYQTINGVKKLVAVNYKIINDTTYSFVLAQKQYNKGYDLVIDPVVVDWSTHIGGTDPFASAGYLNDIVLDAVGNIYGTGRYTNFFPVTAGTYDQTYGGGGFQDAYVMKLNPAGTALVWATYLGGNIADDIGGGITRDATGNIYVCGVTKSTDFPTLNPLQPTFLGGGVGDGFITKLDPNGSALIFSTYIGSSNNDIAQKIEVDAFENVYVVGCTGFVSATSNFPTTPGAFQTTFGGGFTYDAFALKLNATGSTLAYSTFLGSSAFNAAFDLELTPANEMLIVGVSGDNFPTTAGAFDQTHNGADDIFVTKLAADGASLIFSTYVGGSGNEQGFEGSGAFINPSIKLLPTGDICVTTSTTSSDFPMVGVPYDNTYSSTSPSPDGVIFKLNSTGSVMLASTFLWEAYYCTGIDVNANGDIFVTGVAKANLPTTACAYDNSFNDTGIPQGGGGDHFVAKFNSTLSTLMYSTLIGGNDVDYKTPKIRLFGNDCNQLVILSGNVHSTNYPTTPGSILPAKSNSNLDQPVVVKFKPKLNVGFTSLTSSCTLPITVTFTDTTKSCGNWGNNTIATHVWDFGDGTTGTGTTVTHTYTSAGNYNVKLVVSCPNDSITKVIPIQNSNLDFTTSVGSSPTCGQSNGVLLVNATGGTTNYTYSWSPGGVTQAFTPFFNIPSGTITVVVSDGICQLSKTVFMNASGGPVPNATATNTSCGKSNGTVTVAPTGGGGTYNYTWAPGGHTTASVTGLPNGSYTVTVNDGGACPSVQTVTIANGGSNLNVVATATVASCGNLNGTATVTSPTGGSVTYLWSQAAQTTATITGLGVATYTVTVSDGPSCTGTQTVAVPNGGNALSIVTTTTAASCGNLNGTATVTAPTGGSVTYLWSQAAQTTATITGLGVATYTVTVNDGAGCTGTQTAVVANGGAGLTVVTSTTAASCGNLNGTATVTSPTGGSVTYLWSQAGQTTATITGLGVATYTVTVNDGAGCTGTQTASVANGGAGLTIVTSTTAASCGNLNGTATVTSPTGGSVTYLWSQGAQTTATITGLGVATYTVTVNDGAGCTGTQTAAVANGGAGLTVVTSTTAANCGNLNGTATVTSPTGGSVTYLWSQAAQTTATITGLGVATYTVTVNDGAGCTGTQTAAVASSAGNLQAITGSTPGCPGEGDIFVTASQGNQPYTYVWSSTAINNDTLYNLSNGSYTVTVKDGLGCSVTQIITLTNNTFPVIGVSPNTTISIGDSYVLNATGGLSYTWLPATGLSCTNCASPTASPVLTTTYTVIATDVNGCTSTAFVTIIIEEKCKGAASLLLPSAFSPNGDGSNDIFYMRGANCIERMKLTIYNRWGEIVYTTTNPDKPYGWDGMHSGQAADSGVYAYILTARLISGDEVYKTGNVTLSR